MATDDENQDEERIVFHDPGRPRAEGLSPRDAPAPGGSAQGIPTAGERGTREGGLSAEEDFGVEGSGLTDARAVDARDDEEDGG